MSLAFSLVFYVSCTYFCHVTCKPRLWRVLTPLGVLGRPSLCLRGTTDVPADAPTDAPIDKPHLEGPVCRVITYQKSPGGPVQRWSPARKIRRCDCWKTYSYPDRVVLAVDDERKRLASANRRCQTEIERLRATLRDQGARIRELEASVLEEQQRTDAFREQAQATSGHLVRVVADIRDRTGHILTECEALVDDVLQNLAGEGPAPVVPGTPGKDPEENPEEEPSASLESVGSASSQTTC